MPKFLFSLGPEELKKPKQCLSWNILLFKQLLDYMYPKKIFIFGQIKESYCT